MSSSEEKKKISSSKERGNFFSLERSRKENNSGDAILDT